MKILSRLIPFVFLVAILAFFSNCNGDATSGPTEISPEKVSVHLLDDINGVNFQTSRGAGSTIVSFNTHQSMYQMDPKTYEMIPVLAKEKGTVRVENDTMKIDFEIRPEASWDNGDPITGHDLVFTAKLILAPKTNNKRFRLAVDYIDDILVDEANPKKFTVVCNRKYFLAETSLANNLSFFPSYVYDPEGILKKYSFKQLADPEQSKKLNEDEELIRFAEAFNSDKFRSEVCVGSGPYAFDRWEKGQKVVLKKKENWWGQKVDAKLRENPWFQASPKEIVFTVVNDETAAVNALRGGDLDAMQAVPPRDFVTKLGQDDLFKEKNYMFTPPIFFYDFIAINLKDERFSDVRVRKAFAHLMDVEKLIESELEGLGQRVNSFAHPTAKALQNDELTVYEYNLDKAKALLAEAGWGDDDKDGVLNKDIRGKEAEMKLTIMANQGNSRRETTCLLFKQAAEKVGVEVEVKLINFNDLMDAARTQDFDLLITGVVASPSETDPIQSWHSSSIGKSGNYSGYISEEADALIDEIRSTWEFDDRIPLYRKLQQRINDDMPVVFLVTKDNTVCVSKKYFNAYGTGLRSAVHPSGFKSMSAQ